MTKEEGEELKNFIKGQIAHRMIVRKRRTLDLKLLRRLKQTVDGDEAEILEMIKDWKEASWNVGVETTELEAEYQKIWGRK